MTCLREYWRSHDPFVALTAAATATRTLKVGTGITLVTERDPILMAKQVASLDTVSNGRVLLGVGAGWNAEEMEDHGVALRDALESAQRTHPRHAPDLDRGRAGVSR